MTLSVTILVSAVVSLTLTPMMCARLLRHQPEAGHGRSIRLSERGFQGIIDFYGRTLRCILRHQTATLLVAVATLVVTVLLYIYIPKGFFPVQDTGVILGVSEAPQSVASRRCRSAAGAGGRRFLKTRRWRACRSFIGIDGTNTTLNSGRIQINLKPLAEREAQRQRSNSTAPASAGAGEGITLYMQPVQDLTVEDRVSRTQFQYTLEDPDAIELAAWTPKFLAKLSTLRSCAMSPAISRTWACRRSW